MAGHAVRGFMSLSLLMAILCTAILGCHTSAQTELSMPGYWKNGVWVGLPPLPTLDPRSSSVTSLLVSGSDVFAGGYSDNSAGMLAPGYWKNGSWVGLTPPADGSAIGADWRVISLAVQSGSVYAAAAASSPAAPSPPVATNGYWKDGAWIRSPCRLPRMEARSIRSS